MLTICTKNSMINRLPMALCGIQHVFAKITLPVCPKELNDKHKSVVSTDKIESKESR